MIYLDYAANTPVNEEVLTAFCKAARQYQGNANSKHAEGLAAKAEMERITISVANLLGVKPAEIIFTSGATEANNTAIFGAINTLGVKTIITSRLEHHAVLHTCEYYYMKGIINLLFVISLMCLENYLEISLK